MSVSDAHDTLHRIYNTLESTYNVPLKITMELREAVSSLVCACLDQVRKDLVGDKNIPKIPLTKISKEVS